MSIGKGLAFSVLGGGIGAAAWTAVGYFTGWEFGILAWGVGFLAGAGMAMGTGGRGGVGPGVLAAVVALSCVLCGKFATVHLTLDRWISSGVAEMGEEDLRGYQRREVYEEFEGEGRAMSAPAADAEFPPEVLQTADQRWNAMSRSEHAAYASVVERRIKNEISQARPFMSAIAFVLSFGLFGIVWVGLAVSTAYKIGSSTGKKSAEGEEATTGPEEETILPPVGTGFALPEITKEPPKTKGFRMQPDPQDEQRRAA